ncbi:MAG: dihydroorotase [Alphaproteobacteria bacterium]|nr:dihydroorotase [Alphaproteobacteria bacterium]MDX5368434.1 dihydroorotase [Alphaproteobacteria bacterium]MDX5463229.1 dihydroorotase [Alphaproteobacteria bacterium]
MTGTRTLFHNARLLDPATGRDEMGGLLVEEGRIADLGPHLSAGAAGDAEAVDCRGHVLAPGLIDMRVFIGEPGADHRETLETAGDAAAAGGITTMVLQPNTDPVIEDPALVEFVRRRGKIRSAVNVECMAALTKGTAGQEMTEIGLLKDAGALAFTDGDRTVPSALVMRRALTYASAFDALVVAHAEDPTLSGGVMNEGEVSGRLGLSGNPAVAETIAVDRDMRLVALTGARYHLGQVSTSASLDVLRAAKAQGLRVTAGVSAQHLALNEIDIASYRTFFKMRPPLRREEDRAACVAALADGTVDVVVSAHDPQDEESKRLPFGEAAYGAAGLETLLPVLLWLHHLGEVPLATALKAVTARPAELLGLEAGRLAPGAPADLVLIDLDRPWILKREALRSRSKNTPYEDRRFMGRAIRTVVGGRTVFDLAASAVEGGGGA